jgi:hypothetical protein
MSQTLSPTGPECVLSLPKTVREHERRDAIAEKALKEDASVVHAEPIIPNSKGGLMSPHPGGTAVDCASVPE